MTLINWESINRVAAKNTVLRHCVCVALFLMVLCTTTFESIAQSQIQGLRDNTQVYSGVVYGPIDKNDTLWRIASRYKQDARFTVFQTMQAIYDLNPQAFENGNFNTMVNGATLQLPSDRYIARIDPIRAKAKADSDDKVLGRTPGSQKANANQQGANTNSSPAAENLKPEIPLVNQDDLSKTSTQLQGQLNRLKNQQQQQFLQLKNQVAASISSVESLLQENKKLNEQLLKIDENNRNLTQKVETELQTQIDAQVNQLGQLIALVKESEQRRIDEESQSIMQILSTPMALIIIMSSVTLLSIIGLAFFLLRKPAPAPEVVPIEPSDSNIVDDDLVIGEVEESLDQDSEDLMAALSEDDELEEDDILSDALEEDDSIDMLSQESIDSETDLDDIDDMLVPDSTSDIDNDAEAEPDLDLDDDDSSMGDEQPAPVTSKTFDEDDEIKELDKEIEKVKEDLEETKELEDSDEPQPEPIDEGPVADEIDAAPSGINLDEKGAINEDTIEQIGNQIEEKDQTINRMTDELLNELDNNVPNDSSSSDEKADDAKVEAPNADNPLPSKSESDISEELEETSPEVKTDLETLDTPSADDGIGEKEPEITSSSDASSLNIEDDSVNEVKEVKEVKEDKEELDALLEAIDDDFLETDLDLENVDDVIEPSNIDNDSISENEDVAVDQITALTDELLQDLESEDEQNSPLVATNVEEDDLPVLSQIEDTEVIEPNISSEELNTPSEPERAIDADDLLDDIPSFTTDLANESNNDTQNDLSSIEMADKQDISDEEDTLEDAENQSVAEQNEVSQKDSPLEDEEESDEDMLSGLQGLDNWLDEDDEAQLKEISKIAKDDELDLSALDLDINDLDSLSNSKSDEDDIIKNLDDVDFDDMLNDLADDKIDEKVKDEPQDLGLPIDQSSDKEAINEASPSTIISPTDDSTDDLKFVDVDDLLKESEANAILDDDDLELNLEGSLDKLAAKTEEDVFSSADNDVEANQSSNLDLAQVYIDMEDFRAAKELLDEVIRLGSLEQQEEAYVLISKLK